MTTIYEKIRYEHKHYSDLSGNLKGRHEIELLVDKLKPIESDIINDKNGIITIMESGNIFTDGFDEKVSAKISDFIVG